MLPNGQLKTEAYDKGDGTLKYTKTYDYFNPNGIQLKTLRRDDTLPTVKHTQKRFFYTHGNIVCVAHDDLDASGTIVTQAMKDNDCLSTAGGTISPRLEESYGYDDLDRLDGYHAYFASSQTDSGQWTYDALDRPSTEQETHSLGPVNRTTSFEYIGLSSDVAKEVWTGSGATTRNYSYDVNDNKVGMTDTARAKDLLYGYNPHGDVSQLLNLSGTAEAAYGYRPYGDEEAGAKAISQGDTATQGIPGPINNYRFSAKRFDTANKQVNMGARFFSPEYGSFIQEDFLRDALNDVDLANDPLTGTRYGLAGGNPINFVEVDGHSSCSPFHGWSWHRVVWGCGPFEKINKGIWHGTQAAVHDVGATASAAWDLLPLISGSCEWDKKCTRRVQAISSGLSAIYHDPSLLLTAALSDCSKDFHQGGKLQGSSCVATTVLLGVLGSKGLGAAGRAGRLAAIDRRLSKVAESPMARALSPVAKGELGEALSLSKAIARGEHKVGAQLYGRTPDGKKMRFDWVTWDPKRKEYVLIEAKTGPNAKFERDQAAVLNFVRKNRTIMLFGKRAREAGLAGVPIRARVRVDRWQRR
jgi:RHS repeat-associated protein